ncbi:MAG: membrane protein insertion efficiency factor YidD [Oscillospiraceae bacterium]|nr:membrane protein insertion efficiency factor YidD [Oscillospiraceae bacterium]MBQ1728745.1 membrane protein insertion efficiency factor YidD [Oscillospiraceae bacterium]MBQ1768572.1 membrane protein insertion efficiency factor YidD [Oscillospiraceae bacterium]MBQ2157545.1 membrane protein insertion efficiency factor YidD [Oscillospiraceae bacterium]MBQ2231297.1 membrane protein insertion efficiency factor YidD [Oscillospiraceae bacterium]
MKKLLLWAIRFYRKHISPNKPPCCRFTPTCSKYAYEAIEKYGALKGGWLAIKRLSRCHPFHFKELDYYDPVP